MYRYRYCTVLQQYRFFFTLIFLLRWYKIWSLIKKITEPRFINTGDKYRYWFLYRYRTQYRYWYLETVPVPRRSKSTCKASPWRASGSWCRSSAACPPSASPCRPPAQGSNTSFLRSAVSNKSEIPSSYIQIGNRFLGIMRPNKKSFKKLGYNIRQRTVLENLRVVCLNFQKYPDYFLIFSFVSEYLTS